MLTIELPHGRPDVLALNGDLDFHTAHRLQCILHTKLKERHPSFYLDCAGLRFLDSRGIAVMIEYTRDARAFHGQLILLNTSGVVAEVLKIAKLEEHFHCSQGAPAPAKPGEFTEAAAGI
jgi:anti-anti-sigma factor